MKKILILIAIFLMGIAGVDAAVRDGNSTSRGGGALTTTSQKRVATTNKPDRNVSPRTTVLGKTRTTTRETNSQTTTARTARQQITKNVIARAASSDDDSGTPMSETRTGAQYEVCKTAFFTCMDQFCALKNDDYRRCSCSDRINSLKSAREVLTSASEQLTVFTENLDTVGMTAAQATAMRTASDGENALTSDASASKALLQAIMNSIRGGDTSVGGKYSDLNSINMSFDTSIAFGSNSGQIIASYNGQALYSAVYPRCREAVREDCNNASLQRAINAYLMAIEQDCNTVQTAIEQKRGETKSAIREGSALLDLARVENRRKHNTDDLTTCVNNVETAILSEEVCGNNYHKCLDNGEFIDISTGAPITGVVKFYELGNLLKFDVGSDVATQRLSKISRNKAFVNNFEKRTKKFAQPALDKCTEIADTVWDEYLDKAMLTIYYAQQSKVDEIKQGCFDFVSKCYESSDASITAAMSQLLGDSTVILQPDRVVLSSQLCQDYVQSCDNMFDGNIIEQYVNKREGEDVLAACRAAAKQCFDKYGGTGYENFYYPYSGLFKSGVAPDWFALYDTDGKTLKSPCAQQLEQISSCSDKDMLERAFGGLDVVDASMEVKNDANNIVTDIVFHIKGYTGYNNEEAKNYYGLNLGDGTNKKFYHRQLRPIGVATEIYNQIIDTLSTQCMNIQGRFIQVQFLQDGIYDPDNYCKWHTFSNNNTNDPYYNVHILYGIHSNENMCPRDYNLTIDTQSWGTCSCWGNGARRSKNGRSATCVAALPAYIGTPNNSDDDISCGNNNVSFITDTDFSNDPSKWCVQQAIDSNNRVCPFNNYSLNSDTKSCHPEDDGYDYTSSTTLIPEGI